MGLGQDAETARARVLVVDPDDRLRANLESTLRADGFETSTAARSEAALQEAKRRLPDVVLTDLAMEPINGLTLCQRLHEIDRDLPVIVMSASLDTDSVIATLRSEAEDYLIKPPQQELLRWSVERALARRSARLEQERLRQRSEELYRTLNERLTVSSVREQEHAEGEAQQRAQLNALLESLKEGVVIVERDGRVRMINEAARKLLGFQDRAPRTFATLHGLPLRDLTGRPLRGEERPLTRALEGEQFVDYEVQCTGLDGRLLRMVTTGGSLKDERSTVELAIVTFRDVTELRRLEQQRDEFLSLISHDLRNPLSGLQMFCVAMKRSMEKRGLLEEAQLAERAERSASRMNEMIGELTEATHLEASGVTLNRVRCDLLELIGRVVDGMDQVSARRITIATDGDAPWVALADRGRLERVISNILTNALKYSAEDTPVEARLTRREGELELAVVDRGIGIAPESLPLIFERYYRTNAGRANASGLGLGLYIARLIAEAHGGRIEASSEVGKGSTFRLILPTV